MKILITGSNGMLGSALVRQLRGKEELYGIGTSENKHPGLPYTKADIVNELEVEKVFRVARPDVVIHTAAYTNVDGCEQDSKHAFQVNVEATGNIAHAVEKNSSFLIFISSDYVFSGQKANPYLETDLPDPISVYGQSKFQAEQFIQKILDGGFYLIIRTSWLYGLGKKNFVETILKLSETENQLRVASDHEGAPTYAEDLAAAIRNIIQPGLFQNRKFPGILHITNSGSASWYEFAKEILTTTGKQIPLHPICSEEVGRAAKRPSYSVLNTDRFSKLMGRPLRSWKDALSDYMVKRQEK